MKMNLNKKIVALLVLGVLSTGSWSCKKMFDVVPEDKLDSSNAYKNVTDADAAVMGIYGQFLELHKLYILQNELRGDLVDVTAGASQDLKDLSSHTATKANPYVDPRPYYNVIVNCNDALKNFKAMLDDKRMSVDAYEKHYSDIGALRSFIYLQLGIQYGSVPYITEAYETVDDLKNLGSIRRLGFDELLDRLIDFTEKLPYKGVYGYPAGNPLLVTIDGNSTQKLFITKAFILGDLYLWKHNYLKAAENYAVVMNGENNNTNANVFYNYYKISNSNDQYSGTAVQYTRYQDESSLNTSFDSGWRGMFGLPTTSLSWNAEWLWAIPYSPSFKPVNPMIDLTSPIKGYQIKPSQAAIDLWNSQTQYSGIPYDARGKLSYTSSFAGNAITKLTDNGGKWGIYRAGMLHLRFSEAANRDGQTKLGWAFLNTGLIPTYYVGAIVAGTRTPATEAELNTMITPYPKESPYYFDARKNGNDLSALWYRNAGIRNRAGVTALDLTLQGDMLGLENKLLDEDALELAFEGNRWPDLVRIARRQGNPAVLADRIYQKLLKAGNPAASTIRAKLMNPANWYLPFDWK